MFTTRRITVLAIFLLGFAVGSSSPNVRADLRGSGLFPDVQQGSYYDDAIGQMYEERIITGYTNGNFGPNDPVTRGQIAVIMQRLLEKVGAVEQESSSSARSRASSEPSQSSSEDDDEPNTRGAFRFTIGSLDVSESTSSTSVTVVRTEGDTGAVSVEYETNEDTATGGDDYATHNGRLDFADGESSKTITIAIVDDSDSEGSETFTIDLKNPTNGSEIVSPSSAEVRIIDNESGATSSATGGDAPEEGALGFGASAYGIAENAGELRVYVNRRGGNTGEVTVQYATSNGTADAGDEYTQASGTLTFADGDTSKYFTIAITDNTTKKGNKTFNMQLTNPTGDAILDSASSVQVTIIDEEAISTGTGSMQIDKGAYDVIEGDPLTITIKRLGGTNGKVNVDYETVNGTAKSGFDYTAASGTFIFHEGESEKEIIIQTDDDALSDENNEQFTFRIINATNGATLGSPTSTSITING